MSELVLPPWIVPEEETHEWLDEGSSVFRSAFAPGLAQRQSYGGLRLKLSRRHTVRADEKAQLLSVLKQTRGSYNTLRTKVHFARRGSVASTELISQPTFASGSGPSTSNSNVTTSISDRIYRATRLSVTGETTLRVTIATATQYSPYVARCAGMTGRGAMDYRPQMGTSGGASDIAALGADITTPGLNSVAGVTPQTTIHWSILDGVTGRTSGDFMEFSYISCTQCLVVDNGLNLLLRSDELDNASWTKTRSSVSANAAVAPDGTLTGDSIIEDTTAANTHLVSQSVSVSASSLDYSFTVALKAGTRTWARLDVTEASHNMQTHINLATGALGTTEASGANWSNVRAFVVSLGNGWYQVSLVGRKVSAVTTITARILLGTADDDAGVVYNGDGASNIYAWRATLVQSGVPTRLIQTTSTAATGTSQTGNAIHVKGLTASTNGLLLPGDWIEINSELKQCIAPLNSDAAGLGYLQFEPPLVRSPSNDDPVIITDPMGKFLVSNIKIDNEFGTQARVSYDLEHIYE